jgi:septum formation protein
MTTRAAGPKTNFPSLILASASPRRRQLLRQAGIAFRVLKSKYDEGEPHGDPVLFAVKSALGKAREVAARIKTPAWVLGADTVVAVGKTIFGKPAQRSAAARMLQRLAQREHQVVTGVAWVHSVTGETITWAEHTRVRMRKLEPEELENYLKSGEWHDKAGAYGIQGRAGAFVTRVEGCYFNVVGLPLGRVCAQWIQLQKRRP